MQAFGNPTPFCFISGPCGFPLELLHLDNRREKEKGGLEVLWAHTYSSYCVREAGSSVICLPQMEEEMIGG